mgnify:CR=1 FL=1
MKLLLTKRLARSLWRTKLRLFAVVLIIMVGVFAGIAFGHYAHTATTMYDDIYSDSESGTNLGDVWVENPRSVWTSTQSSNLCEEISTQWPDSELLMMDCEPRLVLDGLLFHSEEDGAERLVPAIWHGIDEGYVDRLWMPDHECCDGRLAQTADEIVLIAFWKSTESSSNWFTITSTSSFSPSSDFLSDRILSSVVHRRSSRASTMSAPILTAFGASLDISSAVLPLSVTHTKGFCM